MNTTTTHNLHILTNPIPKKPKYWTDVTSSTLAAVMQSQTHKSVGIFQQSFVRELTVGNILSATVNRFLQDTFDFDITSLDLSTHSIEFLQHRYYHSGRVKFKNHNGKEFIIEGTRYPNQDHFRPHSLIFKYKPSITFAIYEHADFFKNLKSVHATLANKVRYMDNLQHIAKYFGK
jgi:hypothetical protein